VGQWILPFLFYFQTRPLSRLPTRNDDVIWCGFIHFPFSFTSVSSWLPCPPTAQWQLFFMSSYSLSESRPVISPDTHSPDPTTQLVALNSLHMKDITQRHSRISLIYPKKRPSPHGITKLHRSPVLPHCVPARASKSPRPAKAALMQQRQREAQIIALRREGIWLEEEYRDEIRYYMHDMEVSFSSQFPNALLNSWSTTYSAIQCPLRNQWINNLRSDGT